MCSPCRRLMMTVCCSLGFLWLWSCPAHGQAEEAGWKAALGKAKITPTDPMWMAGYAARTKPSEGVVQDLFAKALVLEDANGAKQVIITLDLIGVPRQLREDVEQKLRKQFELPPEALMINASHTHCGPEFRVRRVEGDANSGVISPDAARAAQSYQYTQQLQTTLVEMVGECLARLEPARLSYSHARCGFAMNRRFLQNDKFLNSPNPDGPVDHAVPVLRVESLSGTLQGLLFGYACHNTTLSFYQFCGDYAGYAQEYLEAAHPGVVAMFVLGCGGDQNPYPRRELEMAQQHGRSLANAVEAALLPPAKPFSGRLSSALEAVTVEFAPPPSREVLEQRLQSSNRYEAGHARRLLSQLDAGGINLEYPYLVQVVRLGEGPTLIALSGEVVVDYSLRIKQEFPDVTPWVAGYSNDVFGYVPSARVLREGGYEGGGAMLYTSFPGPFAESIEERILGKVRELLKQTVETP
ncbi:MAG: neutral/alkaline non-lysosomal ceramidase N-terminal domain-containing protein [Planctomycetaceae bacterium]|nr:neutral/alkaline non-lysosomal ceramidase N-terminal domain-containing protein [Planctomycetaceae bacterium]